MAAVAGGRITAGVGANLIGQHAADRNQDATVYVGGLDPQVLGWACLQINVRDELLSASVDCPQPVQPVQMSEELVWELFVQAGPVGEQLSETDRLHASQIVWDVTVTPLCCVAAVNVYLPKDRVTNMHQQYGFVEYRGEEDADYVSMLLDCKQHSNAMQP